MRRLTILLLLLAGCSTKPVSKPVSKSPTDDGALRRLTPESWLHPALYRYHDDELGVACYLIVSHGPSCVRVDRAPPLERPQ